MRVEETDDDPEKTKKLNAFKKKLEERRIVKYWEDGSQLVNDIKDAIHDIVRRRPGVGWIRGDQALDPTVYKDLEDERRQNKELREKLDIIGKDDIVFLHICRMEATYLKSNTQLGVGRWTIE